MMTLKTNSFQLFYFITWPVTLAEKLPAFILAETLNFFFKENLSKFDVESSFLPNFRFIESLFLPNPLFIKFPVHQTGC